MKAKAICFYLPQFHPIPENDEWWGKGFTDWTAVKRAHPLFKGHYQPHLPADLGMYDLRCPETREAQAELARQYDIYGFCYYHYWFNGRRVLERPFDEVLSSGKPDFPFCLCWANENWTRRWDGRDQDILLAQGYSEDDDLNHVRWLAKAFHDPRYIRVNGKPLFLVYRLSKLPDPAKTVAIWRNEAVKLGLPGLFLCNVEHFQEHGFAARIGIDGAVEFAPDGTIAPPPIGLVDQFVFHVSGVFGIQTHPGFRHYIFDYSKLAKNTVAKPASQYLRIPTVCGSWDNTARRKDHGATVIVGSNPDLYHDWMVETLRKRTPEIGGERFVFINAWNEWAEGAHLEPCQRWGRAYLEATKAALAHVDFAR
jgi:lipopolysaccharide biosynthesis protein